MAINSNEYDIKRGKALKWGYLFAGVAFIVFIMFLARILFLQNTNVEEFEDNYISKNYREATLKALWKPFRIRWFYFSNHRNEIRCVYRF